MKNSFKFLLVVCIVLLACTDTKPRQKEKSKNIELNGMWKLKSGVWDNEDGTFLRYPEDSITEGPAYIIYSKNHYMLIANAPKMNYYRGELIEYSVEGDKLITSTKLSNFEKHLGMKVVWKFKIESNVLTAENGKNEEVWERVE